MNVSLPLHASPNVGWPDQQRQIKDVSRLKCLIKLRPTRETWSYIIGFCLDLSHLSQAEYLSG